MQVDLSRSQNGELKGISEMKRQKEEGSSQCSDLTMQANPTPSSPSLPLSSLTSASGISSSEVHEVFSTYPDMMSKGSVLLWQT